MSTAHLPGHIPSSTEQNVIASDTRPSTGKSEEERARPRDESGARMVPRWLLLRVDVLLVPLLFVAYGLQFWVSRMQLFSPRRTHQLTALRALCCLFSTSLRRTKRC